METAFQAEPLAFQTEPLAFQIETTAATFHMDVPLLVPARPTVWTLHEDVE